MKTFRGSLEWREQTGSLLADDVSLTEVETLDEWASWQALGMDGHSQVADPLFVDAAKDDYRLKPVSSALALGFEPIPTEKLRENGLVLKPIILPWRIQEGLPAGSRRARRQDRERANSRRPTPVSGCVAFGLQ